MRYELPHCEDKPIWDIWLSMYHLPAMCVADELGLFQALEPGPECTHDTARRLGLNQRTSEILFCMLAALGLVVRRDGRNELAEISRTYLLPQSPYYWGPLLRAIGSSPQQRAGLIRALRAADGSEGATPGIASHGWQKGQLNRADAERVTRFMHCHSLPASVAVARSGGLDGVTRTLDVGGGSGCFSIALAQHFPKMRCTVMDLPAVCDVASGYIEEGGVSDRVDTLPLDMFRAAWPHGYDGMFFSNIFHDWSAETNRSLAQRAHDALPSGGRIFLHEMLLAEDGCGPITAASFSMLMLGTTQGRQYSFSELRQILTGAGFTDIEARKTYGYYSIVSGLKP
jgi:hypothetical protein